MSINYQLKNEFGINSILEPRKSIEDVKYFKHNNIFILFITTKSRDKQMATYKNIYIALFNLKYFCIEHSINKLAMNKLG